MRGDWNVVSRVKSDQRSGGAKLSYRYNRHTTFLTKMKPGTALERKNGHHAVYPWKTPRLASAQECGGWESRAQRESRCA